jgi:hypothetical protein
MRDASCRGSALAEHRRDLAPAIHASEADLAASHEAEEQDERRVLGRQATLSLHPPPELLGVFHWLLGNWMNVSSSSPPSARLRTTPGQRRRHFRSKAAEPPWAAARLSA